MSAPPTVDPFGTAELRAATVAAWRRSPTRLREDTATEADLVRSGYRDRVLTELAQNAADAAARAGVPGELTVRLQGNELQGGELRGGEFRAANTGAPLDRSGVQALAALRASSKTGAVGRYGVGFTAVLSVSEEPRVLSTSGSIAFSATRTRSELNQADVPVLRLVWPVAESPAAGASTEVVLPLRAGVDGAALLDAFAAEAPELLLALPALYSITVADQRVERREQGLDSGLTQLEVAGQRWWGCGDAAVRWLVRVDDEGQVRPLDTDVLRAPTRTDEELSLPAMLIADVALQPDRRRLLPGTSLEHAAARYPALVSALPPEQRTRLVPLPGFPRSAVDGQLRADVLAALRDAAWLLGAAGAELAPRRSQVIDVANTELVDLLADVFPGLLSAELSALGHSAALAALGVPRRGLSAVADAVSGVHRDPAWWRRLYAALDPLVGDRRATEELAALPVPLVDGRTVLGPRSTVLADVDLAVPGVRVVHPEAAHPLLQRLGAVPAGAGELLDDELLREAVRAADPEDRLGAGELAGAVLGLVDAAGVRPGERAWLGELLLPDADDELRPADELLLPGAPLAAVLVEDAPFGTVATEVVTEYGARLLQAVGVGWGFTVLVDDEATGPGHHLDGEEQWWAQARPEPVRVHAVRDLDLVDPEQWAPALRLLCAEPDTLGAIREPGGYTAWWLHHHAALDGVLLGHWRHAADDTFASLLDPTPIPQLPPAVLAGSAVDSTALAALLLQRLADPQRTPSAAVVARVHTALAAAVDADVLALDELDLPRWVRARNGGVLDASRAVVLDRPWLAQVLPSAQTVLGALGEPAATLAELLDLPLASEEYPAQVSSAGARADWAELPAVVLACTRLRVAVPPGSLLRHSPLTVQVAGAEQEVDWWVDDHDVVHAGPAGVLAALLHRLRP